MAKRPNGTSGGVIRGEMPLGDTTTRELVEATENDLGVAAMTYIMERDRTWVPEIKRLGQRAQSAAVAARDLAFELRAHMPGIPWPNEGAFEAVRLAGYSVVSAEYVAQLWSLLRADRSRTCLETFSSWSLPKKAAASFRTGSRSRSRPLHGRPSERRKLEFDPGFAL